MDLVIFENNKPLVIDEFRQGRFDYVEWPPTWPRPLADRWLLVYNSGNQPLDVAAGTAADVSVRDAELYAAFARWIEGGTDG